MAKRLPYFLRCAVFPKAAKDDAAEDGATFQGVSKPLGVDFAPQEEGDEDTGSATKGEAPAPQFSDEVEQETKDIEKIEEIHHGSTTIPESSIATAMICAAVYNRAGRRGGRREAAN